MIIVLDNIKDIKLFEKITTAINKVFEIIPIYMDMDKPIKDLLGYTLNHSTVTAPSVIGDVNGYNEPRHFTTTAAMRLLRIKTKESIAIKAVKLVLNKILETPLVNACLSRFPNTIAAKNETSLIIVSGATKEEIVNLNAKIGLHDILVVSTQKETILGETDLIVSESQTLDQIESVLLKKESGLTLDLNKQEDFEILQTLTNGFKEVEPKQLEKMKSRSWTEHIEIALEQSMGIIRGNDPIQINGAVDGMAA